MLHTCIYMAHFVTGSSSVCMPVRIVDLIIVFYIHVDNLVKSTVSLFPLLNTIKTSRRQQQRTEDSPDQNYMVYTQL